MGMGERDGPQWAPGHSGAHHFLDDGLGLGGLQLLLHLLFH